MPLPRSVAILVVSLALLASCGEPEDKTPWILWHKFMSKKVIGVETKWAPVETYQGRAKCEAALNKQLSSGQRFEDTLVLHQCWPTGTTPQ